MGTMAALFRPIDSNLAKKILMMFQSSDDNYFSCHLWLVSEANEMLSLLKWRLCNNDMVAKSVVNVVKKACIFLFVLCYDIVD